MMATGKKVTTATVERPLSRDNPQSMCPDVQPFDIFVPHPTMAPSPNVAMATCGVSVTDG